jgi:hypothetical protein
MHQQSLGWMVRQQSELTLPRGGPLNWHTHGNFELILWGRRTILLNWQVQILKNWGFWTSGIWHCVVGYFPPFRRNLSLPLNWQVKIFLKNGGFWTSGVWHCVVGYFPTFRRNLSLPLNWQVQIFLKKWWFLDVWSLTLRIWVLPDVSMEFVTSIELTGSNLKKRGFWTSGIWHCLVGYFPPFRSNCHFHLQGFIVDLEPLKTQVACYIETSETTYSTAQCHI